MLCRKCQIPSVQLKRVTVRWNEWMSTADFAMTVGKDVYRQVGKNGRGAEVLLLGYADRKMLLSGCR